MGVTDAYPHLRHLVFSRTLARSPAPTVEIARSDPVARVRELKAEPAGGTPDDRLTCSPWSPATN
jgi:hypothetical protein